MRTYVSLVALTMFLSGCVGTKVDDPGKDAQGADTYASADTYTTTDMGRPNDTGTAPDTSTQVDVVDSSTQVDVWDTHTQVDTVSDTSTQVDVWDTSTQVDVWDTGFDSDTSTATDTGFDTDTNTDVPDVVTTQPDQAVIAYALMPDESVAQATLSGPYVYSIAGGLVTMTHITSGIYTWTFAGMNLSGGHVQVSTYRSDHLCAVESWSASTVRTRCYGPNATLSDARHVVVVFGDDVANAASITAYVWAGQETTANYSPNTYVYNSMGNQVSITHDGLGLYSVAFKNMSIPDGSVLVSAYMTTHHCYMEQWSGDTVKVGCRNAGGQMADAKFSVMVIQKPQVRTAALVEAYVWANNPAMSSYTPNTGTYSSTGGAVTVVRNAVGNYTVMFDGQSFIDGNAQVSTAGAMLASCHVDNWNTNQINVRCYNATGGPTDSAFVAMYAR